MPIELEQHNICEGLVIRGGTFPSIIQGKQGIIYSIKIKTRPRAVSLASSLTSLALLDNLILISQKAHNT